MALVSGLPPESDAALCSATIIILLLVDGVADSRTESFHLVFEAVHADDSQDISQTVAGSLLSWSRNSGR